MGGFKRLCLFVFGVTGLCALAALSLTWVGPWTTQARSLLEIKWYFTALEVCVCISGIGLLACILAALFAPRAPKESVVAEVPGGQITVTRAAVVAQTRHVIEEDGTCEAASVHVRMQKRGRVRVNARVRPRRPVDVIEKGAKLYSDLEEGLAKVCGESVESIDIVFTEPDQFAEGLATTVETSPRKETGARKSTVVSPGSNAREIVVSMSNITGSANANDGAGAAEESVTAEEKQEPADQLSDAGRVAETEEA